MMKNHHFAIAAASLIGCGTFLPSPASAVAVFSICGIFDNGPGDSNPLHGVIGFSCVQQTGGLMGEAMRFNAPNRHTMIITNATATGTGTEVIVGAYDRGPWLGSGGNRAWTIGSATGGGFSTVVSSASTFAGGDAIATAAWNGVANFSEITTVFGEFFGPGIHTGTFTWDAGDGSIRWPDSNVFDLAVPEPATWAMMIAGFGLIGAVARRKRAAVMRTAA